MSGEDAVDGKFGEQPGDVPPVLPRALIRPRSVSMLGVLVLAFINACAAVAVYHYATAKTRIRMGTVDLAAVYREREAAFTRDLAGDAVSEADRQQAIVGAQVFAKTLPKALDEIAEDCQCVVLLSNAVPAHRGPIEDLTPALRQKVGM